MGYLLVTSSQFLLYSNAISGAQMLTMSKIPWKPKAVFSCLGVLSTFQYCNKITNINDLEGNTYFALWCLRSQSLITFPIIVGPRYSWTWQKTDCGVEQNWVEGLGKHQEDVCIWMKMKKRGLHSNEKEVRPLGGLIIPDSATLLHGEMSVF